MSMDNKFSFISLWDVYQGLLTDTRREITDMYFNLDLTVSEIAAEKGISRQAVSDCLKGCKEQLEGYERKLHILERLHKTSLEESFKMTDAGEWAQKFKALHPRFAKDIDELSDILDKDYSSGVEEVLKNPGLSATLYKDYTQEVYGRKKTGEE